jgi:hypothetical protein
LGDPGTEPRLCKGPCKEIKDWVEFPTNKDKKKTSGWKTEASCKCCKADYGKLRRQTMKETRAEEESITRQVCTDCGRDREIRFFDKDDGKNNGYISKCVECNFLPNMIHRAKRRSEDRILQNRPMPPVNLSVNFLKKMTTCFFSGLPVRFHPGVNDMASLDRINNDDGYIKKNVRMTNIRFNVGHSDDQQWTPEKYQMAFGTRWKHFAEERAEELSNTSKNPHLGCGLEREAYLALFSKSQNYYFSEIAGNANARNAKRIASFKKKEQDIPTGITKITSDDIRELWKTQNGICAYSEIPMGWFATESWLMSIERINEGFYVHGNMALVCVEFNSTEYLTDRFLDLCTGPQGWSKEIVAMYRDLEREKAKNQKTM